MCVIGGVVRLGPIGLRSRLLQVLLVTYRCLGPGCLHKGCSPVAAHQWSVCDGTVCLSGGLSVLRTRIEIPYRAVASRSGPHRGTRPQNRPSFIVVYLAEAPNVSRGIATWSYRRQSVHSGHHCASI